MQIDTLRGCARSRQGAWDLTTSLKLNAKEQEQQQLQRQQRRQCRLTAQHYLWRILPVLAGPLALYKTFNVFPDIKHTKKGQPWWPSQVSCQRAARCGGRTDVKTTAPQGMQESTYSLPASTAARPSLLPKAAAEFMLPVFKL